jgi:hypothetical protein
LALLIFEIDGSTPGELREAIRVLVHAANPLFTKSAGWNQDFFLKLLRMFFRVIAAGSLKKPDPARERFGGVRTTQNCAIRTVSCSRLSHE